MKKEIINSNKKKIRDLMLSIGATAVLNIVIQFAMYPFFEKNLGKENYGVMLSVLALVSILSGTLGTSANYSRMVTGSNKRINCTNGDYNVILIVLSVASGVIGLFYINHLGGLTVSSAILFLILIVLTAFRYYADVEFRLKSNFLRYMLYYMAISGGYLAGMGFYKLTNRWALALIIGEASGIVYALFASSIFRKDALRISSSFRTVCRSLGFLLLSTFIENIALNADRIVLMVFSGGTDVSIYYTASLLGKVVALLSVPINSIIISYLVKYDKNLSKKFWSFVTVSALVLGTLAFGGCTLVSPILLKILYPNLLSAAKPYIAPAVLGQIFYFISGIMLVFLLKFKGERNQFIFNVFYAVEFLTFVTVGTWKYGLDGFVYASLIANALRFAAVIFWGFAVAHQSENQDKSTQE